jgi:PIN domain nuclease of toxin-antitoxin system
MKILVDTHIYLWMLAYPEKLNGQRRYELESSANQVFLSAISIAELMIKQSIGKMDITFDPVAMAAKMALEILDFSGADAMVLGTLPLHHKDPFDRMLIAQAMTKRLVLISDDAKFRPYDIKLG